MWHCYRDGYTRVGSDYTLLGVAMVWMTIAIMGKSFWIFKTFTTIDVINDTLFKHRACPKILTE